MTSPPRSRTPNTLPERQINDTNGIEYNPLWLKYVKKNKKYFMHIDSYKNEVVRCYQLTGKTLASFLTEHNIEINQNKELTDHITLKFAL